MDISLPKDGQGMESLAEANRRYPEVQRQALQHYAKIRLQILETRSEIQHVGLLVRLQMKSNGDSPSKFRQRMENQARLYRQREGVHSPMPRNSATDGRQTYQSRRLKVHEYGIS